MCFVTFQGHDGESGCLLDRKVLENKVSRSLVRFFKKFPASPTISVSLTDIFCRPKAHTPNSLYYCPASGSDENALPTMQVAVDGHKKIVEKGGIKWFQCLLQSYKA